jgi:hypothetical protein
LILDSSLFSLAVPRIHSPSDTGHRPSFRPHGRGRIAYSHSFTAFNLVPGLSHTTPSGLSPAEHRLAHSLLSLFPISHSLARSVYCLLWTRTQRI